MYYRRKAREIALQVLYELDVLKIDTQEAVDLFGTILRQRKKHLSLSGTTFASPKMQKSIFRRSLEHLKMPGHFQPF